MTRSARPAAGPLAVLILVVVGVIVCWPTRVSGERAGQDRATADFVLTGKVEGVYARQAGTTHEYVVRLAVQQVHKGDGVRPGGWFYAYCFRVTPGPVPVPGASGHAGVPKDGQRVKVYVRDDNGRHEGNYPDWFDVLPDE